MSHRIALLIPPLLRLLRRPRPQEGRPAALDGPTVHHTGVHTPKETVPQVAVLGIGVGSCGIPASCMVITR